MIHSEMTIDIDASDSSIDVDYHSPDKCKIVLDNLSIVMSEDEVRRLMLAINEYLDEN